MGTGTVSRPKPPYNPAPRPWGPGLPPARPGLPTNPVKL